MKFNFFKKNKKTESVASVDTAATFEKQAFAYYSAPAFQTEWNGDKFPGSFGATTLFDFVDYWTLRKRSLQLFQENPYAVGIIRRIIRNEIYKGLVLDATPFGDAIWPELPAEQRETQAAELGERLTSSFGLYAENKEAFDYKRQQTFGEFQMQVRMEALICGDGIVVSRINPDTGLPCWEWINGDYIKTPSDYSVPDGYSIKHGVEVDAKGRHVAYHVTRIVNGNAESYRIPVYGEKSGRVQAKMVYGSEKLSGEVRGTPILACMLYMLKELDRYRDAEQRAAVINALMPMFLKRPSSVQFGSRPLAAAGILPPGRAELEAGVADRPRPTFSGMLPGTVLEDLAPGEELVSFNTNRPNVNYSAFEAAVVNVFCWVLEIPPEIGKMLFTSSYSASRQANNEFEVYLKYRTYKNAQDFCNLVYREFVIQAVLTRQIELPGFVYDLTDPKRWMRLEAWLKCAWSGLSRPSVDALKDVQAAKEALDLGITTFDDQCRKFSGKSHRQIMQKLKGEKELMKKLGFVSSVDETDNGERVAEPDDDDGEDDGE